jgi:hypothetical protein
LYVAFDYIKKDTVYVKLNTTDIDTLMVNYPLVGGGSCCSPYTVAKPIAYNNATTTNNGQGITILKK